MTRQKRHQLSRIAEAAALGLAVLSVVTYFALVRPLRSMRIEAEREFNATRSRIASVKGRVARLEQYRVDVPHAQDELDQFLKGRLAARRQGFSHAARLAREMSEASKVRLTSVSYKLTGPGEDPLAKLGLDMEVEGAFPDVMRFAHGLETSKDIITVRSIALSPLEGRMIVLNVSTDLYLKP